MKKHLAEQYVFSEYPWCIFTISEATGTVDCQSDFGDYQYSWFKHGRESLKHFLAEDRSNFSYFEDKFGYPKVGGDSLTKCWDGKNTKKRILEDLKEQLLTPEQHDLIASLIEDADFTTRETAYYTLSNYVVESLYEGDSSLVPNLTKTHSWLVSFIDKCWPRFIEALREELLQDLDRKKKSDLLIEVTARSWGLGR